jgi:hypothetical protein
VLANHGSHEATRRIEVQRRRYTDPTHLLRLGILRAGYIERLGGQVLPFASTTAIKGSVLGKRQDLKII